MTFLRESWPAWADADEVERRWMDPDPFRHDVPDSDGACSCTHPQDDHTDVDAGCAWRGCPCRWMPPELLPWDEYEADYAYRDVA